MANADRLIEVFNEAKARPAGAERERFLAEACPGEPELQEQVISLLQAHEGAGDFLKNTLVDSATTLQPPTLRFFGDYELLEEIARGGMGVVFKARQVSLNRTVALKMILAGKLASAAAVRRFRTEAEAAANLKHPNIVAIHEVGEHEGQHYFSMDYIEGRDLAECVRQGPMPLQQAARCVQTLAHAIHYAHQRGVLHRDLKPSNILLDAHGQPHVTDFGLAKLVERDSSLTQSEAIMGTPSYMAPEQAAGQARQLTTAADIYSLGAILYELLTGQPPFRAGTPLETMRLVLEQEPVPPRRITNYDLRFTSPQTQRSVNRKSQFVNRIDRDLETICLKCLRKDPNARYHSAEALADDLARWQNGEPIRARPVGPTERFWRWCRRRPLIAGLSGAVLLLLVAVAVGATGFAFRLAREKDQTVQARNDAVRKGHEATEQLHASLLAQARANRWSGRPGRRFDSLAALSTAAAISNTAAIRPTLELRNEAVACLALMDVRALEPWHRLTTRAISFDPAGGRYTTDHTNGQVTVSQSAAGAPALTLPGAGVPVRGARFSPAGDRLAVNYHDRENNSVTVWDSTRGNILLRLPHGAAHEAMDFDAPGQHLAVGRDDGAIQICSLQTTQTWTVARAGPPVNRVRFRPSSNLVAVCRREARSVQVYDWAETQTVREWRHSAPVQDVAWGPDGRLLALAGGDRVSVWDTATGNRQALLEGRQGEVGEVFFNPAGTVLASRSSDYTTRFWHPWSGELLLKAPGWGMGFSTDGSRMPVAAYGAFGFWEVAAAPECEFFDTDQVSFLQSQNKLPPALVKRNQDGTRAISPDKRFSARRTRQLTGVEIVRLADGQVVKTLEGRPEAQVAFSPDGQWLVTGTLASHQFWKVPTWEKAHRVDGDRTRLPPKPMAFSPDGRVLAVAAAGAAVRLIEAATGTELATLESIRERQLTGIQFSADGSQLAVFYNLLAAELWDLRAIRSRLATMKLDWHEPGASGPPVRVADPPAGAEAGPGGSSPRLAIPARDPRAPAGLIDLTPFYNASLEAGWLPSLNSDCLSTKSLFKVPRGVQNFEGVEFDVRGLIQLWVGCHGAQGAGFPKRVEGIPLRQPCARLHFLHAAACGDERGRPVGQYVVHFEDGVTAAVPIVYGEDIRDWLLLPTETDLPTRASLARREDYLPARFFAVLFRSSWENPRPEVSLRSLDFISAEATAAPFLVAVSADARPATDPAVASLAARARNLMASAEGDRAAVSPVERQAALAAAIPRRPAEAPPRLLDLTPYYTAALTEDFFEPLDTPMPVAKKNNLAALPRGVQTLGGISFDVRGLVQLAGATTGSSQWRQSPRRVDGIKVGLACRRLHFLHAVGRGMTEGRRVGAYVLHYADGRQSEVPIIYGQDLREWRHRPAEPERPAAAPVAWTGRNPHADEQEMALRLYLFTIENVWLDTPIASLDFVASPANAAPFLVAITAEP